MRLNIPKKRYICLVPKIPSLMSEKKLIRKGLHPVLFPILIVLLIQTPHLAQDTLLVGFRHFPQPVLSMVGDSKGNIWFNTATALYRFEADGIKREKALSERQTLLLKEGSKYPTPARGTDAPMLNSAWAAHLPRRKQAVYTATDRSGVVWATNGEHFFAFKILPFFKRTLHEYSLYGILEHQGDVFAHSNSGLLKNGLLLPSPPIASTGNALSVSPREIWLAARHIYRYQTDNGQLSPLFVKGLEAPQGGFTYLHRSESGETWAGSSSGLYGILGDALVRTDFTHPVEYVCSLGDQLYIASKKGIFVGDGQSFPALDAFPAMGYHAIQKIGDYWWGCSDAGLWKWKEGQKRAELLFSDHPLGNLETYGLLQDRRGYYWVSSSAGLYRFHPDHGGPEEYFTSTAFNQRSFAAIRDTFYFGSTAGLFAFNPLDFPPIEGSRKTNAANVPYLISWFTVLFLLILGIYYYSKWKSSQLQLENVQLEVLNHAPDPLMMDLEHYIRNNISTVTVTSLSEFSGLTERALYPFLQDNYQTTPGDLIRNIKTQRMQEMLLENPDVSRKELARALGYSLSSVFRILSELK